MPIDLDASPAPSPVIGPSSLDRARLERLRQTHDARSLPDLFRVWEALGLGRNLSKNTVENYRHACLTCGALVCRDAEVPELELWLEHLRANGPHGRPLARSSLASAYNGVCAVAHRAGRALGDVTMWERLRALPAPRPVKRVRAPPPADFLARCMGILEDRSDRLWCLACARLATRKMELLGLRWESVDLPGRLVTIDRQRDADERKNHEAQVIILDGELAGELLWAKGHPDAMRTRNGPIPRDAAGRVFPWGVNRLERILAALRMGLGPDWKRYLPPRFAWHQFRRLAAQSIKDAGGTDRDVAATLRDTESRARGYYSERPAPSAPVPSTLPGLDVAPVHRPAGPARVQTDPPGVFRDVATGRPLSQGYRAPVAPVARAPVVAPWDLDDAPSAQDLDWLHNLGRVSPFDESDP